MKTIIPFALFALVVTACQTNESLEDLKKKRGELEKKISGLKTELKEVEDRITELDTTKEKAKVFNVFVTEAVQTDFQSFVEVHGMVQSDKDVVIMPEMNGVLTSLRIKKGDEVKKGQVLATVDTEILRNNLNELKKRLELADSVFSKQKRLWDKKVGTEMAFLQAKNNKEALEESIKTMKTQISKSTIESPIDGKINEIFPKLGEMVSPGAPFAQIVNLSDVYINADVSEALFTKIETGDKVKVRFPYQEGLDTEGEIEYKGNYINPANRTFIIHVGLAGIGKALPPNLLTVVKIEDDSKDNAIVVPSNIIQNDGERDYLYVIKKDKAEKRFVEIGANYNNLTVINSGVAAGEKVVLKGFKKLTDDATVKIHAEAKEAAKK